jgi:hypothetical protein
MWKLVDGSLCTVGYVRGQVDNFGIEEAGKIEVLFVGPRSFHHIAW